MSHKPEEPPSYHSGMPPQHTGTPGPAPPQAAYQGYGEQGGYYQQHPQMAYGPPPPQQYGPPQGYYGPPQGHYGPPQHGGYPPQQGGYYPQHQKKRGGASDGLLGACLGVLACCCCLDCLF